MNKYLKMSICLLMATAAVVLSACGGQGNKENDVDVCSHEDSRVITKSADCTTDGKTYTICKKCGTVLSEEVLLSAGHAKITAEISAECQSEGFSYTVCSACGKTIDSRTYSSLNHAYSESAVTYIAPTEEQDGMRVAVCQNDDGHAVRESIPKLSEDNYTLTEEGQATCKTGVKKVYSSAEWGTYTVYGQTSEHDPDYSTGICVNCNEKVLSPSLGYTLSDDGSYYIIERSSGMNEADVIIPACYKGLPVKEIAKEAFNEYTWLKSVSIPKTIEKIGDGAFSLSALKEVYFDAENCADFNARNWVFYPSSGQSISITFGKDVKRVPARLFAPLSTDTSIVPNVTSVTFEEGCAVTTIGEYAFYKTGITSLNLPEHAATIGEYAFYGTSLTVANLDGVKVIGDGAFGDCEQLESISVGYALEELGEGVFDYCINLKEANLSKVAATEIPRKAFNNCKLLTAIKLSDEIKIIGANAFKGCEKLYSISGGSGVESFGEKCFYGCTSLKSIRIPAAAKEIANSAFEGCNGLEQIIWLTDSVNLEAGNRVFANCGGEKGLTIIFGKNVTVTPARMCFATANVEELPNVKLVIFASDATTIGQLSFRGISASAIYIGRDGIVNLSDEA